MTEHILTGLAALASLRQLRIWLTDAPAVEAQPGLRRSTAPRELTTRAARRSDRLLRTERAERRVTDIPTVAHSTPIRLDVLDAQAAVHAAVIQAAWITASGLRRQPRRTVWAVNRSGDTAPAWWPTARLYRDPWTAGTLHLRMTIPALQCDCTEDSRFAIHGHRGGCLDRVAAQVAALLVGADDRARLVLGIGPAWVALGLACDTCNRRTVEAEVTSPDERDWIVRCGNGCWIGPIQEHPRARSIATLKSIRRHQERQARRERTAA